MCVSSGLLLRVGVDLPHLLLVCKLVPEGKGKSKKEADHSRWVGGRFNKLSLTYGGIRNLCHQIRRELTCERPPR